MLVTISFKFRLTALTKLHNGSYGNKNLSNVQQIKTPQKKLSSWILRFSLLEITFTNVSARWRYEEMWKIFIEVLLYFIQHISKRIVPLIGQKCNVIIALEKTSSKQTLTLYNSMT